MSDQEIRVQLLSARNEGLITVSEFLAELRKLGVAGGGEGSQLAERAQHTAAQHSAGCRDDSNEESEDDEEPVDEDGLPWRPTYGRWSTPSRAAHDEEPDGALDSAPRQLCYTDKKGGDDDDDAYLDDNGYYGDDDLSAHDAIRFEQR